MRTAVYPGSFDPPTNGHIDIALRAAHIFDKLIISVSDNPSKSPLFAIEERMAMLQEIFKDHANVEIHTFDNLLIHYVKEIGAQAIVRGLRAVSDFEYELQMASFNAFLNEEIDTVFFMAKDENLFVSSSIIKEVALYGGDVSAKVHPAVWKLLREKVKIKSKR